jgi:hypothetical protein
MTFRLAVTIDPPHAVLVYEKKKLRAIMRAAGNEIAAEARKLIKAAGGGVVYRGSGSGKYRPYQPGSYAASTPGGAPANVTGTLLRSIKSTPSQSGQAASIRAGVFYALFLEVGAKGGGRKGAGRHRGALGVTRELQPRPFLSAALTSRESSIADRIRQSIVQDIAFKRMK